MKLFLRFAGLSGLGWLCDFLAFVMLVKLVEAPNFIANFLSSYVGVTFVWVTSLKVVFKRSDNRGRTFLALYWSFQFVSIMAYSQLLHIVASAVPNIDQLELFNVSSGIAAKIIVTPFNLVTNFLFMKFLTRFMRERPHFNV